MMPLDSRIRELLGRKGPFDNLMTLSVAELRARARQQVKLWREAGVTEYAMHRCEDRIVSTDAGDIPVRAYWPSDRQPLPIMVYIHGGGWVTCDLDTHDGICRGISSKSGAIVISVDYRKPPEHPFPVPLEDCAAVIRWAVANAQELGGNPRAVFVAGDSSGGNLAAVLALECGRAGPSLSGQVLLYPVVDGPDVDYPSIREFWPRNDHGQRRDLYLRFVDLYLGPQVQRNNPRFAPIRTETLKCAPPTLIITAHYDILRDEAEAYARCLADQGVDVEWERYDGVHHGFLHLLGVVSTADNAMDRIGKWVRTHARSVAV